MSPQRGHTYSPSIAMKHPRVRLHVEQLPCRLLPSGSPLTGHGQGTFTSTGILIDVGPFYHLTGSADLRTVGQVSLSGTVEATSIDGPRHAGGDVTLRNGRGSVEVELQGPLEKGFAPLPDTFPYRVVTGSGAYAHLQDQGKATLRLVPAPTVNPGGPIVFMPGIPREVGTFTLALKSQG